MQELKLSRGLHRTCRLPFVRTTPNAITPSSRWNKNTSISFDHAASVRDQAVQDGTANPIGQNTALMARRHALAIGCACCFNLVAPGMQSAAKDNGGFIFSYGDETGPESWGGTCSTGMQQSPIDLPSSAAAASASCSGNSPPVIQYRTDNKVQVKNTGTTIQVNFEPGNTVSWQDQQLELLQYHFHTPSEHAWDGNRTAMEAHLVHKNNTTGGYVVFGVMLQPPERTAQQSANPCLTVALKHVPQQPQTVADCPESVDPLQLMPTGPAAGRFVHYAGSLTTPPCSENVDWLVWQQPISVTERQVVDFMAFAGQGTTSQGQNSRPLQPLNGRVLEYNCLATA